MVQESPLTIKSLVKSVPVADRKFDAEVQMRHILTYTFIDEHLAFDLSKSKFWSNLGA
jgi:hypothetical protein